MNKATYILILPQYLPFVIRPILSTIYVMIEIVEIIERKLLASLLNLGLPKTEIKLEHPTDTIHGDYSSNVAMILAKDVGKSPYDIATQIMNELEKDLGDQIERVEAVKPGFINFHLSKSFFAQQTKEIKDAGEDFGKSSLLSGTRVLVEYTQPNPFKEFHIGHLMSNAVGESLSRVIEFSGAEVIRANYQGDVGLHVAKCIWGIQNKDSNYLFDTTHSLDEQVKFMGQSYVLGNATYEENADAKNEIIIINKKIYERNDKEINKLYDAGRTVSLAHFETIYNKLGTKFDYSFFESQTWQIGRDIVLAHLDDGIFERSDKAIIFPGEKYGLHTRVFINSEGITTYEAKDIGLCELKNKTIPNIHQSIITTAVETKEYFKVVHKAFELIYPEAIKTTHVGHGFLRLTSGKMSSRLGNVITGESLLTSTYELAMEKINGRGLNEGDKKEIAETVAVGAIKYTILRQSPGKDIIFDPEKSISFEGDSGPYLQYSYTRALSVLKKAEMEKIEMGTSHHDKVIYEIEKVLYRFPEVVALAYHELAPSYIVTYLIDRASHFNSFYAQNKIIDNESSESAYRLALTENFSEIMKSGLYLLGIKALNHM
jgi:arginyl-tRNA synthetase